MDHERFDDLARSAASAAGTRRAVIRLLAGGALGGVATRLGLSEVTAAKPKQSKSKPERKRQSQAERKSQGAVQAEGKGRKKKKKRRKKPDLKPLCAFSDCEDRGGRCCPDQSCATTGTCCLGEKQCVEGGSCHAPTFCCPNTEKECQDGSCVPASACCDGKYRCDDGACIDPFSECCPKQKLCNNLCISKSACCQTDPTPTCGECDEVVCDNGSWACRPRADLKQCPDGLCIAPGACCPPYPQCGQCEHLVCENGESVCRPIIGECDPGGEWDPALCRCRYCHEICDEQTGLCQSIGCPAGYHCEAGQCLQMCTNPIRPQLCCLKESTSASRCVCRFANDICYGCPSGGMCACVPDQTCCPPEAQEWCPQACREAEICQD